MLTTTLAASASLAASSTALAAASTAASTAAAAAAPAATATSAASSSAASSAAAFSASCSAVAMRDRRCPARRWRSVAARSQARKPPCLLPSSQPVGSPNRRRCFLTSLSIKRSAHRSAKSCFSFATVALAALAAEEAEDTAEDEDAPPPRAAKAFDSIGVDGSGGGEGGGGKGGGSDADSASVGGGTHSGHAYERRGWLTGGGASSSRPAQHLCTHESQEPKEQRSICDAVPRPPHAAHSKESSLGTTTLSFRRGGGDPPGVSGGPGELREVRCGVCACLARL